MFRGSRTLIVASHPDDIEFGAFGTLLRFGGEMKKLYFYIATLGGEGDESNKFADRKNESERALKLLNPDNIFWFDRIGLKRDEYHSEVARIEGIMRLYAIDLILSIGPHDSHQDHRLMSDIVSTAVRRMPVAILYYATPSISLEFSPRMFVDITDYLRSKLAALKHHESQESKPYMTSEYLEVFHSDPYAALRGMRYVEKFEVERFLL